MNDLISRQTVLTLFEKRFLELQIAKRLPENKVQEYEQSGVNWCINTVRDVPSVENKGEWIPVTEKLPSDCGHDWVLAQIQEDNGYLWIPCVAEYRKLFDDWFTEANEVGWLSKHKGAFKVIAWQPLPEPYKEDMRGEANEQT